MIPVPPAFPVFPRPSRDLVRVPHGQKPRNSPATRRYPYKVNGRGRRYTCEQPPPGRGPACAKVTFRTPSALGDRLPGQNPIALKTCIDERNLGILIRAVLHASMPTPSAGRDDVRPGGTGHRRTATGQRMPAPGMVGAARSGAARSPSSGPRGQGPWRLPGRLRNGIRRRCGLPSGRCSPRGVPALSRHLRSRAGTPAALRHGHMTGQRAATRQPDAHPGHGVRRWHSGCWARTAVTGATPGSSPKIRRGTATGSVQRAGWELLTHLGRPGRTRIRARAADQADRTQPGVPEWNRHGYGNNAVQEVDITATE